MAQFYTLLTDIGQAKLANAIALGQTIVITHLAVGDGGGSLPTPDSTAIALVNEVRRAPINTSTTDPDNPTWIVVEQILPPDVGGWTVREIGIFDADGDLIGIGNYPETYKPVLSEGSSRTQTVRFVLEVSDTAAVTLKIDPSVVLATREYVDAQRTEHEQDSEAHTDDQITISAEIPQAPGKTKVSGALAALGAFAADGYTNFAVFDSPGVVEWPVPNELKTGLRKAHVMLVGGGGGGANGGGGAGAFGYGLFDLADVASVTITTGEAGAEGTVDINGGAGGTSSFGVYMSAGGGSGGNAAGGRSAGGAASGGVLKIWGGSGQGAGQGGMGGVSTLSSGGAAAWSSSGSGARGQLGTFPGGGGGGASNVGANGGAGGAGLVIVRW